MYFSCRGFFTIVVPINCCTEKTAAYYCTSDIARRYTIEKGSIIASFHWEKKHKNDMRIAVPR